MTTFREKGPYSYAGFPDISVNLQRMVGASGPGDDAGGHDAAKFLVTILANAANQGLREIQVLQEAGVNDIQPTFDPTKTAAAALAAFSDFGYIDRPVEKLETPEAREERKARQAAPTSP